MSPLLRVDFGGRQHNSNKIINKYFSQNVDTPHIHFYRIGNSNKKVESNAITFDDLISYLIDLSDFNKGKLNSELDINTNSYGMPYLDIKNQYMKMQGIDGQKQFQEKTIKIIKNLENCIKFNQQLTKLKSILKRNNSNTLDIEINDEIELLKYKIILNVSEATFQENLKNFSNEKIKEIEKQLEKNGNIFSNC